MNGTCYRPSGFTLIELVVAITLSTIVIGFAAMFMTAPVDTYFAQSRRSEMVHDANALSKNVAADLRKALPNSVRISNAGTRAIIEFLNVESVAFYRNDDPAVQAPAELDIGSADQNFDTLGQLFASTLPRGFNILDRFLVVGHDLTAGRNAYQLDPVIAGPPFTVNAGTQPGEDSLVLNAPIQFLSASARQRIYLVTGPVSYICNSAANARTLIRYEGYPITGAAPANEAAAQLNGAGVNRTVISTNVNSCRVTCVAGAAPCRRGLTLEVSITRPAAGGNETMRVFVQAPVENVS